MVGCGKSEQPPQSAFSYRPFAIAETFGVGPSYRLELERITSQAGARRRRGRVTSIDPAGRLATMASGEQLPYDLLVVACGARPEVAVSGALTFRGEVDEEAFRWLLRELDEGSVSEVAFVVPPGPSWRNCPRIRMASSPQTFAALSEASRMRTLQVTPRRSRSSKGGSPCSRPT